MSAAAFGDTFIVSWSGVTPFIETDTSQRRGYFGHLSTFNFTEADGFKKVNDFWYEACLYGMGEVTISKDGQIIGALCAALPETHIPGAIGDDPPKYGVNRIKSRRNKLYLFEWQGGKITQEPDVIVLLQTNIGGAKYGHWSIKLNDDATKYFIRVKVSTHHGGHESAVSKTITRGTYASYSNNSSNTGCGGGHSISNRVVYNTELDAWAIFCGVDAARGVKWVRADERRLAKIIDFDPKGPLPYAAGGAANMISRGSKGWMAAVLGPSEILKGATDGITGRGPREDALRERLQDQLVGIRKLPPLAKTYLDNIEDYPITWITPCDSVKSRYPRRPGLVQLHNWGIGGEKSDRMLLGFSPSMRFQGISDEYHVVEINGEGEMIHDPVVLQKGAWGEDSLGVHLSASGCVVFPFAWVDEDVPTFKYPTWNEAIEKRSKFLRLTAVCPDNSVSPKSPKTTCQQTQNSVVTTYAAVEGNYASNCSEAYLQSLGDNIDFEVNADDESGSKRPTISSILLIFLVLICI